MEENLVILLWQILGLADTMGRYQETFWCSVVRGVGKLRWFKNSHVNRCLESSDRSIGYLKSSLPNIERQKYTLASVQKLNSTIRKMNTILRKRLTIWKTFVESEKKN